MHAVADQNQTNRLNASDARTIRNQFVVDRPLVEGEPADLGVWTALEAALGSILVPIRRSATNCT